MSRLRTENLTSWQPTEIGPEPGRLDDVDYPPHTGLLLHQPETSKLLGWHNSRIRSFNDSQLDHLEYYDAETGEVMAYQINDELRPLIDDLRRLKFAETISPVPDRATLDWYIALGRATIETIELFLKD